MRTRIEPTKRNMWRIILEMVPVIGIWFILLAVFGTCFVYAVADKSFIGGITFGTLIAVVAALAMADIMESRWKGVPR